MKIIDPIYVLNFSACKICVKIHDFLYFQYIANERDYGYEFSFVGIFLVLLLSEWVIIRWLITFE